MKVTMQKCDKALDSSLANDISSGNSRVLLSPSKYFYYRRLSVKQLRLIDKDKEHQLKLLLSVQNKLVEKLNNSLMFYICGFSKLVLANFNE
jgi:hypothetical protein